ncbi:MULTISPECIES: ABC transporter substrate-binding protein [unclassified Thermoactinomyces]|jgi:polar amino acid transport system substrate-binding protein|uniref:ABC transporter substrate-binding protein n=1 Tax=unclassified Thermoactinomyces TaxID=2634588 RepID=UPI0018DB443D|nr:ABC transporter substrate-binding protein [Thermoactinomyces sp. CICC 10523]MBH8605059.1 ABC transporter substrate-binding protein [Thermoactinomyces sp. CICC 10522]MBH8606315.1 ABC transporter substrate-binding protein [Thermoactinomyces sp. CICC 10521]
MAFLGLTACAGPGPKGQITLEKGTFSFAMSGLYKPFNYRDFKNGGRVTGFDVEIGKALAKEMGLKPKPVTTPWETIIAGLQAQKYDAIIGSMAITDERKKAVDFTDPYYRSGAQIFVKKGNRSITSAADLKGKKIGVVKASTFKDVAAKYSPDIVEYTSDITALQDLPTDRIDAVITDQAVGLYAMNKMRFPIQDVGKPLTTDNMAIAVRKGNDRLREKMNRALQKIIADGTYERISQKYFNRNILTNEQEEGAR